jgi:hypothetical protein
MDAEAKRDLLSFPTLFAYETLCDQPARVGRLTDLPHQARSDVRFEFSLDDAIAPITPSTLHDLAWDLDIGNLELSRTHWAIKDVDLLRVLRDAGHVVKTTVRHTEQPTMAAVEIAPTVFSLPSEPREDDLVALMMPFDPSRAGTHQAVREACGRAGLRCVRADDIWEDSTIIQDIFALIYRSRVVVADLSELNGNVLYETGIAHTLGRPVVPISTSSAKLPFDLAHHRTLFFNSTPQGLQAMSANLERRLRHLTG